MRRLIPLALVAVLAGGAFLATRGGPAKAVPLPGARGAGVPVLALTGSAPAAKARGALSAHLPSFSAVSPSTLSLGPDGTIAYRVTDAFTQGLTGRGAALYPVLRDPAHRLHALLANAALRRSSALRLARIVRLQGAQGLVLDPGTVAAADRLLLPAFLRELRADLPPANRLFVIVPPIAGAAQARAAVGYDLRDLARPATLIVRAYGGTGRSDGPHPIAPLAWYRAVVRYTLAHAPRARVVLSLPTWGAVWTDAGVRRETQAELFPLASARGLAHGPDGARVTTPEGHGWVETDRSLQLKLEVARAARVAGIALSVRGGESAGIWDEPLLAPAS